MICKTRQQLADEYAISTRTLTRWLKRRKIALPPGLICPRYVDQIYQEFGLPEPFLERRKKNTRKIRIRKGSA